MTLRTKGTLACALALVTLVPLAGCTSASGDIGPQPGGKSSASTSSDAAVTKMPLDPAAAAMVPADVKAKGSITAVYAATFPPFEFYGKDNKTVVGFDVDFIEAVGQSLGLKIEIVPASFDTILPGLASKKYDLSDSSLSITDERKKNADFIAYAQSGSGIGVPPGNPKKVKTEFETLCGLKLGAGKGTTQGLTIIPGLSAQCVGAGKPAIVIQLFPSQGDMFLALRSNRVDGVMTDSFSIGYQGKLADGAFELAPGPDYGATSAGIALPKDSPLTEAVRAAVIDIVKSPVYHEMNLKWGLPDTTTVTPEQVAAK